MSRSVRGGRWLIGCTAAAGFLAACDSTAPQQAGSVTIAHAWTELEIGQTLQLSATVLSETGSTMSGHPVVWSSSAPAVASVSGSGMVNALAGGTTLVRATSDGKSDTLRVNVRSGPCTSTTTAGTIAIDQTRSGTLGPADCRFFHGPPAQGWRIDMAAAGGVRIDLASTAFDAVLIVTDLQLNVVASDDDGGLGTNARVLTSLDAGSYIIWASTFHWEGEGSYQLAVVAAQFASCAEPVGTLAVGQTVTGALTQTSCIREGRFADPWTLTLTEAATVRIDLMSAQFDAFLLVSDAQGNIIAGDDDGGEGFNSRLVYAFGAGTYTLFATTYWPGEIGSYQLAAQPAGSGELSLQPARDPAPVGFGTRPPK